MLPWNCSLEGVNTFTETAARTTFKEKLFVGHAKCTLWKQASRGVVSKGNWLKAPQRRCSFPLHHSSRNPQRSMRVSCDWVLQPVQPAHLYHQLLCRPLKLCRATRANTITNSCSSLTFFLKTSVLFCCPSISLPLPCLPGLICHCGLIISACSLYSFQPANLPLLVAVTVAAQSCPGLSTWPPPDFGQ